MVERDVRRVDTRSDEHVELLDLYPRAEVQTCSDVPNNRWTCTRPPGHTGIHVGHIGTTRIGAYWVREEPTSD